MSLLSLAARGIYWTIGAVQSAAELVGATRRLVTSARQGVVPHVDDTQPIPLTYRDVARQQSQIRAATKPSPAPRR